jgi:hypothetical protein
MAFLYLKPSAASFEPIAPCGVSPVLELARIISPLPLSRGFCAEEFPRTYPAPAAPSAAP